ncbi:hypothetical protein K1T71_011721 [Dendrolimus kikuchii]|uniref:Uncharacterized protein n=1 Tax=Dendrolimus kikuchii TaxID=765133 RepID=A0ACC1CM66_9NEOP|nr:hypothetical protein K1T71_011721 [Dendrolimus kikuchii]
MKKIKTKSDLKDTFYTLAPINWILTFFALNCVRRKNGKLVVHWSLLRNLSSIVTIFIVITCFLYGKVSNIEKNEDGSIKFINLIEMTFLLDYVQYIIDLYYVFKTKHVLIKYYENYDHIDKITGMTYYKSIRTSIAYTFIINIVIILFPIILDYLTYSVMFGWLRPTLFSIDYFFNMLNTLTIVNLTAHVIQMTYRLKRIESIFKHSYTPLEASNNIFLNNWDVLYIKKCYLMLLEQTEYVNYIYGFRMVLFSLLEIIWMVSEINIAIRVTSGSLRPDYPPAYFPGFVSLLRLCSFSSILFSLVHRCEQTYKKNKNIVNILDFIIMNECLNAELKSSLVELRDLVFFRPIVFHASDYFTINKKLLVSVCSVVVTYSIIFFQNMD